MEQCRLRVLLNGHILLISGDPTVAGPLTLGVMGNVRWKCQCEQPSTSCVGGVPALTGNGFSWETCLERGPCEDSLQTRSTETMGDNGCSAKGGPKSINVSVTVLYDPNDPFGYGTLLLQLANELENLIKTHAPPDCGLGEIPNTLNVAMKRARLLAGKPRWIQDTALRKYLQD